MMYAADRSKLEDERQNLYRRKHQIHDMVIEKVSDSRSDAVKPIFGP